MNKEEHEQIVKLMNKEFMRMAKKIYKQGYNKGQEDLRSLMYSSISPKTTEVGK